MDTADSLADELRAIARLDTHDPAELAAGLGLRLSRRVGAGCQGQLDDVLRVSMRGAPEAVSWRCAHELGHLALDVAGVARPHDEQLVNAVAAAIICPRREFRRAFYEHPFRLPALARVFRTTETIVALRAGEVFDLQLAVVWSGRVVRRGEIGVDDGTLRRWARHGGEDVARVVPLTDARRFVVAPRDAL
jgi:hypothetical protein